MLTRTASSAEAAGVRVSAESETPLAADADTEPPVERILALLRDFSNHYDYPQGHPFARLPIEGAEDPASQPDRERRHRPA